ncbi:MAG: DUF853 family protein, partial [Akkermansiaceae bacterium]|nr:DUF853 family protein [Verrucomicrobiales bacterium]
ATALTELAVGEALVSFLDEKGQPGIVERAFICPPRSQIGPIKPEQRQQLIQSSLVFGTYEKTIDRESAYERLKGAHTQASPPAPTTESAGGFFGNIFGRGRSTASTNTGPARGGRPPDSLAQAMAKSAARTIGSTVGREIIRGIMGSIFGGRRR